VARIAEDCIEMLKRISLWTLGVLFGLWALMMAYAYWPGATEVPVTRLATSQDRFVNVAGVQLRYRRYGSAGPGRPQLLLLHGFANSLQSWRVATPLLAACCDVIAIDMLGFGLSDKPADADYHNRAQAERVVAAAHALGHATPVYVGHSLGGAIALQAAVLDREARGLVLMNPGIISTGVPKIVQLSVPPLPRLSARMFGSRSFRADFLRKSYVNPAIVTDAVLDELMLGARSEGYASGMTSMMKQYSEGEEIALAPQVKVPTLILWGDQDRNKPLSEATQLQAMLPGSKLVRFPDAGHYVHEEAAVGVAQALQAWLASSASMSAQAPAGPP
jgi:pimeloyl-ACP methyl ester carboxylesterase